MPSDRKGVVGNLMEISSGGPPTGDPLSLPASFSKLSMRIGGGRIPPTLAAAGLKAGLP
jgi:hypothetical protein